MKLLVLLVHILCILALYSLGLLADTTERPLLRLNLRRFFIFFPWLLTRFIFLFPIEHPWRDRFSYDWFARGATDLAIGFGMVFWASIEMFGFIWVMHVINSGG